MKTLASLATSLVLALCAQNLYAQKDPNLQVETTLDKYTVNHTVFNSTFVPPEVAKALQIKRSKNESILNVTVIPKGKAGGIAAEVSGTVTNLMQQQNVLRFKEIEEKDATYYIAPVRIGNEEVMRFELQIKPKDSDKSYTVTFKQTVYADE